jgi:hypothetical protein
MFTQIKLLVHFGSIAAQSGIHLDVPHLIFRSQSYIDVTANSRRPCSNIAPQSSAIHRTPFITIALAMH